MYTALHVQAGAFFALNRGEPPCPCETLVWEFMLSVALAFELIRGNEDRGERPAIDLAAANYSDLFWRKM